MQKILHAALLAVLVAVSSDASASVKPHEIIKKGTRLIYDVNYMGTKYEFTVTIKNEGASYTFDWSLSSPINKKGTVTYTKAAMDNATGIFNFFTSSAENIAGQCAVILSKKLFNTFKENNSVELCTDKKNNVISIFGNPYNHTQTFGYNNDFSSEFDCRTVTNGDDYQITYVNDPEFPLIIEMNLDWSMKLRNIVN
jgi:hypothetical protein